MTNPIVDSMIGRSIAQYEVLARRGGGGMGVVYEARDTRLGRRVALKFLPPQWTHDEAAKQRFIREAQAASATDHPNICTIHDIGTSDDGRLFIVMAFYEGETLKERLARGALPIEEALDIATQVADGLARAHTNGVVHRDIKPGNVILTEDGARIIDFGLATFADALQLTLPGSTLGTAAYMSPEQTRGEDADARSDVWAAGVVLYEMLTGHVPFRGAYVEAIAYAIRNDAPPPPSAERPEVPEDVERVVFRALHKDPAIRYQNGRELARALRHARGLSTPLDLRTQPIEVPAGASPDALARRRRWPAAVAAVVIPMMVAATWLLWPVERIPILVAPVTNLTRTPEIEQYRLALTQAIIERLSEARDIRPVMYSRMLSVLRAFIDGDDFSKVSSPEAVKALAESSGAEIVAVPTLLYEDGAWRGRVEFLDARTLKDAPLPDYETEPAVSPLPSVTSYRLVEVLASGITDRFRSARSRALDWIAAPIQAGGTAGGAFQSHEAALEFERGSRLYDILEYAAAARAFEAAEEREPNHPLPPAWRSRIALVMGERQVAIGAAARAVSRITDNTRPTDRLFAEATSAEARGAVADAERRYRALVSEFPDEPIWLAELGGFFGRQGRFDEAISAYERAVAIDPMFAGPYLELCRMHDSTRKNEVETAVRFGERARAMYTAVSDDLGQAQALLCLAEVLRHDEGKGSLQAAEYVDEALATFRSHKAAYNLARGLHYAALVRGLGDLRTAAEYWEQSLEAAATAGNTGLHASVASNLGVAHEGFGDFAKALEYYEESYRVSEARRDERLAAYNQANAAALRIAHGIDPERGLREAENALAVVRRLPDRNFEALARQMIANHYRLTGDYEKARSGLDEAFRIASELKDLDAMEVLTLDRARLLEDAGQYGEAFAALESVAARESSPRRPEARTLLGRLYSRLGDDAAAVQVLGEAAAAIESGGTGLEPALHLALGEVAYRQRRIRDARSELGRAAGLWRDSFPAAPSVEAEAYLALLDAEDGRFAQARTRAERSLEQSLRMQMVVLEWRCRMLHAQISLLARRPADALAVLPDELYDGASPELQAAVSHLRARALQALGEDGRAASELMAARNAVQQFLAAVPAQYRSLIGSRPAIMSLLQ